MESSDKPTTSYCRKCMKTLPIKEFYEAVDGRMLDSNGYMSVCKDCINSLYNEIYLTNNSIEKTLHKMCISLNIKYYNEAVQATKTHVNTLLENGKNVNAIFGIYKMKLVATQKSMDKSNIEPMPYEDVATIYYEKEDTVKEVVIPQELKNFWGNGHTAEDIQFLEKEYANFKTTHRADSYAEVTLLKEVCYLILKINKLRENNDQTKDELKLLQDLMKSLAISPNVATSSQGSKSLDTFGLWIQDIEKEEPAQWLMSDPRGDIYRDVAKTDEYFNKYFVRPLMNAITGSRDFNIDDEDITDEEFSFVDDGETE